MSGRRVKRDLYWLFVLLALPAVVGVVCAGLALVAEFDRAAAQREQIVVANGLLGRIAEVSHLADPDVVWDDAVRHLDNAFDPIWARDNIGTFLWENRRFEDAFVLSPEDRPIFAANRGRVVAAPGLYAPFGASLASLLASVRREEIVRRARVVNFKAGEMVPEPNTACALANVDGSIYILSATLVQSDFGKAAPLKSRAPVVVTAMRLDSRFVETVAQRFLLDHIRLDRTTSGEVAENARTATAFVVLRDDLGRRVATLSWKPQTPGSTLLRQVGPLILLVLLALTAGMALLYRRARRALNSLVTSEARATHLAYHDALTSLPNRVLFYDRLAHALHQLPRTGEALAVYCLDLDSFKVVNDTYGHHIGDELIQKAGRIMAGRCRESDTVARLSGDEFAIIQTPASAAGAAMFAARLTEDMRGAIELEVGPVFIGCSVGITLVSDAGLLPAEILRQADFALYRTKETAKGQFCFFEPEMDAAIKMRRLLETDLRAALADGKLHMAYQPQVNERTGITGVEALMRWHHPERGDISPSIFVSLAEECGLIVELGMFALRQAFEDSRRWKNLRVAVNISAKQLRRNNFVTMLMELVAEMGVNPKQFELEVTEGILLGDDAETHTMLCQLREHGFELAFDDFGTGYSSLSYLQRYPISRIKIDQSFIANLGVSDEAEPFIVAIVELAKALRLAVIAEGVETIAQRDRLILAGCPDMQGYLFSKPVLADEVDLLWATPRKMSLAA